jgi:hypothetical protein
MIEKFFTQPKTLSRLHASLQGSHLSVVEPLPADIGRPSGMHRGHRKHVG